MTDNKIIAYTDGACKGNGKDSANVGGFGAVIYYPNGTYRKVWGGNKDTTNNQMELTAVIVALEHCPSDSHITLYTDSNYVVQGITKWLKTWQAKNWRKADGKPVLNQALWQKLYQLSTARHINWQWVKGHNGDTNNELADSLANLGVSSFGNELFDKNDNIIHRPLTDNFMLDNTTNQDSLDQDSTHQNTDIAQNLSNKQLSKTKQSVKQASSLVFSLSEQNPDYDGDTSRVNPDFVPILPDPINKNAKERQLIMDTETTGFEDKNGDRIVEIGVIELVGRKFTGEKLHVYLNPQKTMDDEVIGVHGISNEFVSDKPLFADVAKRVFDFMAGAEIIAHNANFDMRFLDMEFTKAGFDNLSDHVKVTDSLALAKQMYPGQGNSLNALVKRLDVGKKDRTFHGALLDSEILAEVYLAMTGGQVSLDIDVHDDNQTTLVASHQDFSELSHLLCASANDYSADKAWRDEKLTDS